LKRAGVLVLVLLATGAATLLSQKPLPPLAAAEESNLVEYAVSYDPSSGTAGVSVRFRCEAGSLNLHSALSEVAGPQAALPTGYLRDLRAFDESGSPLEVKEEGGGWTVQGSRGTLLYTLDPAAFTRASAGIPGGAAFPGPYLFPAALSGYVLLPAPSLLLLPGPLGERGTAEEFRLILRFDPPAGWETYAPRGEFETDARGAARALFLAAEAARVEPRNGVPSVVAIPAGADPANLASLEEFSEKMSSLLREAAGAWSIGDTQQAGLTMFIGPQAEADLGGPLTLAPAPPGQLPLCAFVPSGPSENILGQDFILRSLSISLRTLLGGLDFAPEAMWFREGASLYCGLRAARSQGLLGGEEAWDRLAGFYARYLAASAKSKEGLSAAGAAWAEENAADLLAAGGAVAAATLDARLAERGLSLDGFIAQLLEAGREGHVDGESLLEGLRAYAREDFSAFFRDHVEGTAKIPASDFSRMRVEGEVDSNPAPALPSFKEGHKWVYIVITAAVVFAVPFLLEPYTLRPRRGSVEVREEGEDEEGEGEE